jgi:hypothetical protein
MMHPDLITRRRHPAARSSTRARVSLRRSSQQESLGRVRSCTWKRWPFITPERRETPQRRGKRTDIHRLRGHVKEMREQAAYLAIEHTNELATPGTGMPRSRSAAKQKACSSFKSAT